ncbi:hypothetical protein [Streptomyces sp. NPDC005969]|uniref:hypothetical protein n=1 Tax=Streptomyces sp. NPDC005969 TaxID=3156722 RepID=UPI0033F6D189
MSTTPALFGPPTIDYGRREIAPGAVHLPGWLTLEQQRDLIAAHRPPTTPAPATTADIPTATDASRALSAALRRNGFTFTAPTGMGSDPGA